MPLGKVISSLDRPTQIGPTSQTLVTFNNTTIKGAYNATDPDEPQFMSYDATTGLIYVSSEWASAVEAVSPSTGPIWSAPVPSGAYGAAPDDATGSVYVAGGPSGNVTEVNTTHQSVVGTYILGSYISDVAFDPALHDDLLVTDEGLGELVAWNVTNHIREQSIVVGVDPTSVTVDPVNGDVIVTNGDFDANNGNLTVLSGTPLTSIASVPVGNDPIQAAIDPSAGVVVVANQGSGNVTIVNMTTWTVTANVAVGTEPNSVTYDAAIGDVDVANVATQNVSVLDPSTAAVVDTLTGFFLPYQVVYDPVLRDVYVEELATDNMSVIDGATNAILGDFALASLPSDVIMDTDNDLLYVPTTFPYDLLALDPVTLKVVHTIKVGTKPAGVGYDPVQDRLYTANSGVPVYNYAGSVSVVDGTDNSVIATVPTAPQPVDVQYDPDNGNVYVASEGNPANSFTGAITVINATTDTVVTVITDRICHDSDGVGIDPVSDIIVVGCLGYQPNPSNGSTGLTGVDLISGENNSFMGFINTHGDTSNEQYDPFNGYFYATVYGANAVAVFNPITLKLVANISVGYQPQDLDVDSNTGDVFVAQLSANTVTVINDTNSVVAVIPVGAPPTSIGFDPLEGSIFVSSLEGTVDEIPVLGIPSFTASPATTDVGNTTHLVANVPDGNAVLTFTYSNLPTGCASANTSDLPCTPTASGSFPVDVAVVDNYGKKASSSLTLQVNPDPTVTKFTVSPISPGEDNPMTLTVTASGGTPPLSYSYTGLPAGCASSNVDALTCSPTAGGTFNVTAVVEDSIGQTATRSMTLTVSPAPQVTLSVSSPTVELGGTVTFTTTIQGGGSGDTISYGGLPSGCASTNTATLSCQPEATGTFQVVVTVTNVAGAHGTATVSLTVTAALAVTGVEASPAQFPQGESFTLTTAVVGGIGVDSFSYQGLPVGCSPHNASTLTCKPSASGTFHIEVVVTDQAGARATGNTSITVTTSGLVNEIEIAGGIGVVVVAILVIVLWRRRQSSSSAPAPTSSPAKSTDLVASDATPPVPPRT